MNASGATRSGLAWLHVAAISVLTIVPDLRAGDPGADGARLNGDTNCDDRRDLSDAVLILNWLFLGGSRPCPLADPPELTERIAELEAEVTAQATEIEGLQSRLAGLEADLASSTAALDECETRASALESRWRDCDTRRDELDEALEDATARIEELEIPGCTDPDAANRDCGATVDDGSCVFAGCTDPDAANFDARATIDDGSCRFENSEAWSAVYDNGFDESLRFAAIDSHSNVVLAGGRDVVKYDAAGQELWRDRLRNSIYDLALDEDTGDVFLASLPHLHRYSSDGQERWTSENEREFRQVAFGGGSIYTLSLSFGGDLGLGRNRLDRYDLSGRLLWSTYGNPELPWLLLADSQGNAIVVGAVEIVPGEGRDLYVVKYTPDGTESWSAWHNALGHDSVGNATVDAVGNVYVTGTTLGDTTTVKFSAAGHEDWAAVTSFGDRSWGQAVAVSQDGEVFVAGLASPRDVVFVHYTEDGAELASYRTSLAITTDPQLALSTEGTLYGAVSIEGRETGLDILSFAFSPSGQNLMTARYSSPGTSDDDLSAFAAHGTTLYVVGSIMGRVTRDAVTLRYDVQRRD